LHLVPIPYWFNVSVVTAVTVLALWKGRWPEQVIGASQFGLFLFGHVVCRTWQCWGAGRDPIMVWRGTATDGVLFAICLACALRAERYWVIWASATALLCFVTSAMGVSAGFSRWAYGSANVIFMYGLNVAILSGVWCSVRTNAR
jgi:hypothetical protein